MNQNNPIRPANSLIQRAAQVYGFERATKDASPIAGAFAAPVAPPTKPDLPVADAPAPVILVQAVAVGPVEAVDLHHLREGGFIVPGAAPTRISEEFRIVKRHLLLAAFGGAAQPAVANGRCILVCSAQPNEGKTFCAVNLALSLATEPDIEVLLVDADVAKPEVLSTLGIAGNAGLMDALADPSVDAESLIIRTDVPKLSVLPAGRQTHNDTELLASARGKQVIEALHTGHPSRIVVIDTAPVLAASPVASMVQYAGQVLMVVRADKTSENDLREAVGMMTGQAQLRLLLNGTTFQGGTRKYGAYYGYGEVA